MNTEDDWYISQAYPACVRVCVYTLSIRIASELIMYADSDKFGKLDEYCYSGLKWIFKA